MKENEDRSALNEAAKALQDELDTRCHSSGFRRWPRIHFRRGYTDGWYVVLGRAYKTTLGVELWLDKYSGKGQRRFWFGFRSRHTSELEPVIGTLDPSLRPTLR